VFQLQRNFVGVVGWTLCTTAFFVEFGSMSLVSWATFMVAGVVPPLLFMRLAGGPPITIAEVLFNVENDKRGSAL
jgi:hypothetical protein